MIKQLKRRVRRIFIRDSHPELPIDPDATRPGRYRWPIGFRTSLILAVFIGGCIGTFARDWISNEFISNNDSIPIAILVINISGAFLLGLLLESLDRIGKDHGVLRIIRLGVGTGFCGGFTTYSTASFEAVRLLEERRFTAAILQVCGNLGLSLLAVLLGTNIKL